MADTELSIRARADTITEEEVREFTKEGEITAILEMVLKDKNGNVVDRRVQKSESFVRGFMDMLNSQMNGGSALEAWFVRDLWGGYVSIVQKTDNMSAVSGAGGWTLGICVGTGTNAPTITDCWLQGAISHGTGAGQLQYGAMTFGAPASDSTASHFTLTRDFANGSGGSITVNEVVLMVLNDGNGGNSNVCAIRDVISGGYAVPNGQTLTLNYRIICNV